MGTKRQVGKALAWLARKAPFERGRWRLGSAAYRLFGMPEHSDICTIATRHGFRMALDRREFVDRTLYCTGEWEPLQTELFAKILRPGDSFADVGANIGYFTLLGARLVGPAGKVHAIEANAATHKLLSANIALNAFSQVTSHLVAAGERAGFATVVAREDGNAGADAVDFDDGAGAGDVAVVRLDDLLAGQTVRLLKIDIEGAEAKAIYGAERLLDQLDAPDIVFEFTPRFMAAQGDDPRELLDFLQRRGYRMSEMTNAGLRPITTEVTEAGQIYLYCTKRGAPA